jgi:hypothetical protein
MPAFGSGEPAIPASNAADGSLLATSGRLCSVGIFPTGAVTPTVTIYDNPAAASGTILFGPCKIQSGVPFFATLPDEGIDAATGIYVHADAWTTLTVQVNYKK